MKRLLYLLSIYMFLFSPIFAQETTIIQDNLQSSTVGTKVGGTLTSEGYKPGIGNNHILYDVPVQVKNGYVQFEIKGFSPSLIQDPVPPEGDADNGFLGMYDGRGISEPIKYFDDFKYNYFRWNFHWRENKNAVKCVLTCAAPTSERINSTYAVFPCGGDCRDWFSEPTGSSYNFNASSWYTVKVEWKNKAFKVTINGTTVWSTSGPYDYAPIDFKIWLGSAPGTADKYKNMVPDIIYRNFKLVSYDGVQGSVPNAPSNLSASKISSDQINLSWTDNSNDESGFKIERKEGSGGTWSQITTVGSNNTTYQNSGLTANTTYYYRVRAYNSVGNSSYTNEANATTDNVAPNAPSNLSASKVNSDQINLSWTDNSNDESGFKIERKEGSSGTWSQITTVGSNNTTYQNTGLTPNTTYYYRVRAYNSAGNSSYSNEANATTDDVAPLAPSDLTAEAIDSSQILLNWTDNSDNETDFKIDRKTGADGTWSQITTVGSNVTEYQDTNLIANTTYYYRVKSHNSLGSSSNSNEANATTDDVAPLAPSDLTAEAIDSSQILLNWTDNSDNESGFKIERKLELDSSWSEIAEIVSNDTLYQDTNLVSNTTYYYRIRAYNSVGNSSYSNEVNATTDDILPIAPDNLSAKLINDSQIYLIWKDNSNNEDGFKVERMIGTANSWTEIALVGKNDTLYQDTSLVFDKTHHYRILAYNSIGNSNYSNEVSILVTGIKDLDYESIAQDFILYDNYPNPFNPSTDIKFSIPEESTNSLKVYDITGREVALILNNETLPAGIFKYKFNSRNLPSGVYLCVFTSSSNVTNRNYKSIKKMMLLK